MTTLLLVLGLSGLALACVGALIALLTDGNDAVARFFFLGLMSMAIAIFVAVFMIIPAIVVKWVAGMFLVFAIIGTGLKTISEV